ncbi:MAG: hypothetical protein QHH06_09440 [Clostridiales bacterium]|nr:photosystem II reaction center PsbP family protein [Eubacteriales bacterium]MDH7566689.1 hypothetical protein [Clostridiales bacterium]
MLQKAGLSLAIFIIITAVLSGCGQGSSQVRQNTPSTTQGQVQSSTNQATASAPGSTAAITDAAGVAAANTTGGTTVNTSGEKAVAPEKNPPGDIPDTQVFVKYSSPTGGYELQTPEGWARTENGGDVKFVDKFDGLQVNIIDVTGPVTLDSISKNQAADLVNTGRAVKIKSIKAAKLSGQQAFIISYDSNSDPDPVTNKQIRLENQNFYFYKGGKMAVVKVWAPLGADNVDQWNYISQNFKWR